MKELKKIIISLLIVGLSLIVVDLSVGFCGDKMMTKIPNYGNAFAKENYRLERCNEDVLILGSSRASHHYISSILLDSINSFLNSEYTIANLGIDGTLINSSLCVIESMLDRYTPKLIVLEINSFAFLKDPTLEDYFIPLYKLNYIVKKNVNDIGSIESLQMQCNMYRYNRKIQDFLYLYLKGYNEDNLYGYRPIQGSIDNIDNQKEAIDPILNEYNISTKCKSYFLDIARLCNVKGVKLVISSSPRYKPKDNNVYIGKLCEENNIPFINMYNDEYFNSHSNLFKDKMHLNDEGAHIFTNMFFQEIKIYLK